MSAGKSMSKGWKFGNFIGLHGGEFSPGADGETASRNLLGGESPMYDSELRGWHKEKTTTTDQLSRVRKETLWMNFEPAAQCSIWDMGQPGG